MLGYWSPPDSPQGPGGVILSSCPPKPTSSAPFPQNLYRHAKDAFGHYPNYDTGKLADPVCDDCGWVNHGVRFYIGVPSAAKSPSTATGRAD